MRWTDHLMIAPILLPLATGALLLLLDERRHFLKAAISLLSTLVLLAVAIVLVSRAAAAGQSAAGVYLLGNWPAPFGIVLVLDRLSAMMLLLAAVLAVASLVFSLARWHKSGPHFHTLFQFLLMGLNGAFLTGDIFNLFVFFEILLAASYGLILHGSGPLRVKAGLHYIAVNLAAASLFLIGVSLIYGVTGTLNMADLALRIPAVAPENRMLLEAGAALLGVAFLVKAGMWPLSFWLPTAYTAAAAPVAAVFALLSKVGIYVILRLSLLLFGAEAGASSGFGASWLLLGGMATLSFGAIGVLASQSMGRLGGFTVLVSSGTLLAAIGMTDAAVTSGALYYMVSST
ncbi:MAG: monovalent cation/H+ antiporter subunit D, partial [Alphaproteobacteria bacterium]